jgi:nitroreductase
MQALRGYPAPHPLFDLIATQRACRAFSDAAVDDRDLELIITAGTFAPSAENKQPWEFIVIRDGNLRTAIHDLVEGLWANTARASSRDRLAPDVFRDVDHGFSAGGLRTAPVVIVVCADLAKTHASTAAASIFPCVQNMLLSAHALSLGSALTTLATHMDDQLRQLLRLPPNLAPQAVLPIGVPAKALGPPRREPMAAHTHRDQFGIGW